MFFSAFLHVYVVFNNIYTKSKRYTLR